MPQRTTPVLGLLALLIFSTEVKAEGAGHYQPQDASGPTGRWAYSLSGYYFALPDGSDYLVSIATANRGALRFEARYNYENIDAGSVFAGWTFTTGETISLSVTPMLGAVVGTTRGVAPGVEISVTHGPFDFYFEGEYVFDFDNRSDSFFYAWSEVAAKPIHWLRGGLVAQRTSIEQSDRDIQLGGFAQILIGPASFGVYVFNPGTSDWFTATSLELRF